MNNKALQWLYQELPTLVKQGILPQATADKLHEYYGALAIFDKKRFIIILCSILGASLIGLGIVLLFAHNWEQLSRPLRAVVALAPLLIGQVLAFVVLLRYPTSYALKESTATFISLMVGAAIALVSQTYNILGDMAHFILSWMLLIVPVAYLMEVTSPAVIYVVGIAAWVSFCWDAPQQALLFWPLLSIIIPHFIWLLHQNNYPVRSGVLALTIAISIYIGAKFSLGTTWPSSWMIIDPSIAAIFYLGSRWPFKHIAVNWQRPWRLLGELGIFVLLLLFTFRAPWLLIKKHYFTFYGPLSWVSFIDYFFTLLLVGIALTMFFRYLKYKDLIGALFGALPLLAIIGYSLGAVSVTLPMLLFNVFLFIVSIVQITLGIRTNSLQIVNMGMLMLTALILVRFFDSDVNFIIKGLVFILIGTGFLVTNVAVIRRKKGIL